MTEQETLDRARIGHALGCPLWNDIKQANRDDLVVAARESAPVGPGLVSTVAAMARREGGCEKGHRAGQWHAHDSTVQDWVQRLSPFTQARESAPVGPGLERLRDALTVIAPRFANWAPGHSREWADRLISTPEFRAALAAPATGEKG